MGEQSNVTALVAVRLGCLEYRMEANELDRWNAALYANHSAHHRAQDEAFLCSFALQPTDQVLDLGSGTGEFTVKLAARVPQGWVLGIDGSPSQVQFAQTAQPGNVEYRLGRLEQLAELLGEQTFDAAISRATLHWLPQPDHPALLPNVFKHLRPGGFLRAEFGGHGHITAVISLLDEVATELGGRKLQCFFPTDEQYLALLQQAGFSTARGFVRLVYQRRSFPTFEALVGLLRSQPYVGYEPYLPAENVQAFCVAAEARAKQDLLRQDGSYDLDFVRLDLLAYKPC